MSTLSETDEDVAVAISMQFLVDRVFGSSLYGAVPQHSTILQSIIHSMGDYCSPIRGENGSILVTYTLFSPNEHAQTNIQLVLGRRKRGRLYSRTPSTGLHARTDAMSWQIIFLTE